MGWAKLPNLFPEKKVRIGGLTIELKFKCDLTATGPDEDDEKSGLGGVSTRLVTNATCTVEVVR